METNEVGIGCLSGKQIIAFAGSNIKVLDEEHEVVYQFVYHQGAPALQEVDGAVENWHAITPPLNVHSTDVTTMEFLTLDHYVTLLNDSQAGLQVAVDPVRVEISLFSLKRALEA